MDSDTSFNPDDLGPNINTDPVPHDDPSANLDMRSINNDDPGIPTGSGPSSTRTSESLSGVCLRCINCGLNISRMRRHPLEIAEVRCLIQQWVRVRSQQMQVSSDSLVCHLCWTAAWNEIRGTTSQQQSAHTVGHTHVCIGCGRSLLRIRFHSLTMGIPREDRIRNMIAREFAPRELPRSGRICHNCWRRAERAAARSTVVRQTVEHSSEPGVDIVVQPEQESVAVSPNSLLLLPNYIRAASTQSRCFYPNCLNSNRLTVPSSLRVRLFCDYNFYVPSDCRICHYHLRSNLWDLLMESIEDPIKTFTADQVEEFASLLKDNMFKHLDFENIHSMPENILHYYLGFTHEQFENILLNVPRLSSMHRGPLALAAYLIKLRTGDSDERLSKLLEVPRSTLERLMNGARDRLYQDFVPNNLGINHISRDEITQRNLIIPNGLYGHNNTRPIIIADGTYIYIEKSSNYLYQKKTYSLHKFRNLIKPFLIVATDGYIIDVLGPYPATTTDADIINQKFGYPNSPFRQYFQAGDVFILDRGFRDSLALLENCGYQVHVPLSPHHGQTQLTTSDANRSRAVTLCRWVVEVVNGIFKSSFKIFRQNYFNRASKHVQIDFAIAAALINKYHVRIRDREDAVQILGVVRENMHKNNDLSDYVIQNNLNRVRTDFQNINVDSQNVSEFPTLTHSDLILIACGTYQIKQARSYYGEHIRFNGCYRIEVCHDRSRSVLEGTNFGHNYSLMRAKIASRHVSRKTYFVYILINANESGRAGLKQYCCNCIVGRRTVGCCAHVMTVIWYLGWARHQGNIYPPAQFLDEVLIVYDDAELNE